MDRLWVSDDEIENKETYLNASVAHRLSCTAVTSTVHYNYLEAGLSFRNGSEMAEQFRAKLTGVSCNRKEVLN